MHVLGDTWHGCIHKIFTSSYTYNQQQYVGIIYHTLFFRFMQLTSPNGFDIMNATAQGIVMTLRATENETEDESLC